MAANLGDAGALTAPEEIPRVVRRPRPEAKARDRAGGARRLLPLAVTVLLVLATYVASSLTYDRTLASKYTWFDFHNYMADAFLDGHLDVKPVPPGLLELDDPYDAVANEPFRRDDQLHDLALYDGKIYAVHGPTQAILLNIPYQLLGFGYLNNNLSTLIWASGGFLAAVALTAELRRRFMPTLPVWAECSMLLAIGLATPVWWIVTVARAYESSIAGGYCLLMIGAACLLRGMRTTASPNRWWLAAGSFALAAAVGNRTHPRRCCECCRSRGR